MSLLHLFSHILIIAGAKEDSADCLLYRFKDKMQRSVPESREFALDDSEDIRGDIFTYDVRKEKKSVRGVTEYFNPFAIWSDISTWI